jgi:hypothetical protein
VQSDEDVAALRAKNFSQAAQIERLLHSQGVARQERDEALAELKHVREELQATIQARTLEDRNITIAVAEMGASNEKIREALRTTNMKLEATYRALEGEREAVGRLQTEIGRLRCVAAGGDPYRTVHAEVVKDLSAEVERLMSLERSAAGAAIATARDNTQLRGHVIQLQRALNALAREAGAFKQQVEGLREFVHFVGLDLHFDRITQAISSALATAEPLADLAVEPTMRDLARFFNAKAAWSAETFGPGDRYAGVVEHIRGELEEILAKPSDLTEWIDVVLLAMDGAWRSAGANGATFAEALIAKDQKNRARKWPDWRTLVPGQVSEHIRTEDELAPGTKILFSGKHEGRVVGVSNQPSFGDGFWYEVDHEPWVEGGPTRITVHRDNMVIVAPKETP